MKKMFYLLLLVAVLASGCGSSLAKYKLGAVYDKLPDPDGRSGLAYGYIYTQYPLREVIVIKVDDGRLFRADLIPSTSFQRGFVARKYYIANLPPGKYGLYRVIAARSRTSYGYRRTSTYVRYLYLTFPVGTKKLRFQVDKNSVTYLGALGFMKPAAKKKLLQLLPASDCYYEDSDEDGRTLILDAKEKKEWENVYKGLLISSLVMLRPNSGWLPLLKRGFPDYQKWADRKDELFSKKKTEQKDKKKLDEKGDD